MMEGATSALTGYPNGPAAPAAPGAPVSPAEPGFPGMPSSPRVPAMPCKAERPLKHPKHSPGCRESSANGSPMPKAVGPPWYHLHMVGTGASSLRVQEGTSVPVPGCHHPATQCRVILFPTTSLEMKLPLEGTPIFHPTQLQPAEHLCTYSFPTYRQPWKSSRTWVSHSALKQEGCSAAWSWQRDTGDPELGVRAPSTCAWATSIVSVQHQDKPGQQEAGPGSCKGFQDPCCQCYG